MRVGQENTLLTALQHTNWPTAINYKLSGGQGHPSRLGLHQTLSASVHSLARQSGPGVAAPLPATRTALCSPQAGHS
jgi:hypothetical protein